MSQEIEIVSDGDGIALFGSTSAIELFIESNELDARKLDLARFAGKAAAHAGAANQAVDAVSGMGAWLKLTPESAKLFHSAPSMMKGSDGGAKVFRGIVTSEKGRTQHILQFMKSPATQLTNPALLAGAAGIMAQYAMQKQMEQITDYLAKIDAKVDDVLRALKDSVFAEVIGVSLVLDEAMIIREKVGRVSDVTWSKVQGTVLAVAKAQAYALRQLEAITEKVERKPHVDELAEIARDVESNIRDWLTVLARSVQLQDATAVIELDRVLDSSPEELEEHRIAIKAARDKRRDLIVSRSVALIARMAAAATDANTKVLLNPISAKTVVQASNRIAADVTAFLACLGEDHTAIDTDAKRWIDAASEAGDKAIEIGAAGLGVATTFGAETADKAKVAASTIAGQVAAKLPFKKRG
ncbi:MAG: hypothetical protein ACOYBP_08665 [Microbacteriaceae bacterium]